MKKIIFGAWLFLYTAFVFAGVSVTPSFGQPYLAVHQGSAQTITTNVFTKVQLNTVDFDSCTPACYDPTTNYRWTPNKAGKYLVTVSLSTAGSQVATGSFPQSYVTVYKNGAQYNGSNLGGASFYNSSGSTLTLAAVMSGSAIIPMNGTTDYLEVFTYLNQMTTAIIGVQTYFNAYYLGP